MHDAIHVIRVILIICAVFIVNGCIQLIKVAAKAGDKKVAKDSGKRQKNPPDNAKQPTPAMVLAAIVTDAETAEPAPKKRGRPKKANNAATTPPEQKQPEQKAAAPETHAAIKPASVFAWSLSATGSPYTLAEFARIAAPQTP